MNTDIPRRNWPGDEFGAAHDTLQGMRGAVADREGLMFDMVAELGLTTDRLNTAWLAEGYGNPRDPKREASVVLPDGRLATIAQRTNENPHMVTYGLPVELLPQTPAHYRIQIGNERRDVTVLTAQVGPLRVHIDPRYGYALYDVRDVSEAEWDDDMRWMVPVFGRCPMVYRDSSRQADEEYMVNDETQEVMGVSPVILGMRLLADVAVDTGSAWDAHRAATAAANAYKPRRALGMLAVGGDALAAARKAKYLEVVRVYLGGTFI